MMNEISKHENISAMQDGEMSNAELDRALKQLLADANKEKDVWSTYHLIGDVIRSDDLATPISSDFMQRFNYRFEAEPILLIPAAHSTSAPEQSHHASRGMRQYLRSYMAIASATAAVVFVFVFAPQLSHFGHDSLSTTQLSQLQTAPAKVQLVSASNPSESALVASADETSQSDGKMATQVNDENTSVEMVRDPRIDSYLIAHQRFSPAIGMTAQYVTPANTTATASGK